MSKIDVYRVEYEHMRQGMGTKTEYFASSEFADVVHAAERSENYRVKSIHLVAREATLLDHVTVPEELQEVANG